MVKLAVIADDLTGALDTGIKFSQRGIHTQVFTRTPVPFQDISEDTEAIVIDTETRHRDKDTAGEVVFKAASACVQHGIRTFYKKTDSALRGHVGAELAALHKAVGKPVRLVAALPREDRYTKDGIHYIKGVPVADSIFGKDPFNPVPCSSVKELLQLETDLKADTISLGQSPDPDAGIIVYDGRSEEDLLRISQQLKEDGALDATAGCAGFANSLAEQIDFTYAKPETCQKKEKLIVISGSINEVTGKQLAYAQKHGFFRHSLTAEEKLAPGFLEKDEGRAFLENVKEECRVHDKVIYDVFSPDMIRECKDYADQHGLAREDIARNIAARLGQLFVRIAADQPDAMIMIIGGDTFFAAIKQYPDLVLNPICEPAPGTVLIRAAAGDHTLSLLSKSGGFGEEDLLIDLAGKLIRFNN